LSTNRDPRGPRPNRTAPPPREPRAPRANPAPSPAHRINSPDPDPPHQKTARQAAHTLPRAQPLEYYSGTIFPLTTFGA